MAKVTNYDETHKGNLDLDGHELRNAVIQNLASDPASPVDGQVWYRTDLDEYRGRANGATVTLYPGSGGVSDTAYAGSWDGVTTVAPSKNAVYDKIETLATQSALDAHINDTTDAHDASAISLDDTGWSWIQADDVQIGFDQAETQFNYFDGVISALTAADIDFTPAQGIAATDVQAAIEEALTDAKSYADGVAQGLSAKDSVRVATTAAGTLASSFENGDTVDGVTLATGDRILIKNQAAGAENGIYTVNASGAPTRAVDFDSNAEVAKGAYMFVEEGSTNADSGWVLTTDGSITLGTTSLAFTQFSGAGQITAGSGLSKTGNTLDVNTDTTTIEVSSDNLRIAASAAGAGLTGGGASALAVGAGTGITVNANDVAIDTSVVVRKFSQDLTGGATSEVVTHNLGTRDVVVQVRNQSTPWAYEDFEVEATSTNTITVRSSSSIPGSTYRVVITG